MPRFFVTIVRLFWRLFPWASLISWPTPFHILPHCPDIDKSIGTPHLKLRTCQKLEFWKVYEPVCTHSNCLRKLRSDQEAQAAGYHHGTQDQEGSAATLLKHGLR
jgi:hypothetical protein